MDLKTKSSSDSQLKELADCTNEPSLISESWPLL